MNSTSTRYLFAFLFLLTASFTQAQKFHYVVIGSFADEINAQKFTGFVRMNRYNAVYDLHSEKKMYYVYVLRASVKEDAVAQAKQLQAESDFKDAWVFSGLLDREKNSPAQPIVKVESAPEGLEPQAPMDTTRLTEPPVSNAAEVNTESSATADSTVVAKAAPIPASAIPPFDSSKPIHGKLFRFVIEGPDGNIIPGRSVHFVDFKRGRDIATYKGNEYLDIMPPPTVNNPMTIACAIFGYKEVVQEVDYNKPGATAGITKDINGAWVIPYKLEPLNTGDVSVMYRVAFYKDAVVMLPVSKDELDQLVYIMTSNPSYKIKIHGHCNGNNARKIIAIGAEQNFFDMKGSNEIKGTAKELSKLRAEAVQTYLTQHGIAPERSEIYAWGGSNMLVSETSTSAKLNDRIEIEILQD